MKLNFKRISALVASALMVGVSAGIASAANYPAPFVSNGTANVAIVYGSGAALSDSTAAGSIATSLSGFVSGASNVTVSGEAVPLDGGTSSRIWLNTTLTNAKSIYTKTDLPTVLADSTFSGATSTTVTSQITMMSGTNAGGANSNKVEFDKQPTGSVDPSVGLSLDVASTDPIYNASVNFGTAENFSSTTSQGPALHLFGKDYVVSASTSTTNGLVLFQSAQTLTLSQGGTAGSASATVSINGVSHTVQLINAGTSSATVSVDGTSQSVNVGSSVTISGVSVAITSVQSSTAGGNTATVLVGANKLIFKNGQAVTQGDNNQVILGTLAYLTGDVNATTSLTVAVSAPDTTHDWVGKGDTFVDPVFGSFAITNNGLSSDITDTSRDSLKIGTSGSTTLTLTATDKNGNKATFDWATNASAKWNLSTSSGYSIYPYENANLSLYSETLTGTGTSNQYAGEILQLQVVYNDSSTALNDYVQFYDPVRGTTIKTQSATTEGYAPLIIDGRSYNVTYGGAAGSSTSAWAQIKYPTSDSANAGTFVLYPTLMLDNGESAALYAPLNLSLHLFDGINNVTGLNFPNGNGFSGLTMVPGYLGTAAIQSWNLTAGTGVTLSGTNFTTGTGANAINVSFGKVIYTLTGDLVNRTYIQMYQPGKGLIAEPALVMFEGKDVNNNYNAVVIDTPASPAGTSSSGVGVSGVYFTSTTQYGSGTSGVNLYSNSNIAQYMDSFGTLVTKDSTNSGQPTATITYPSQQVYAQLYLGASSATVSAGNLGNVLVTDSQVSTVSSKNLVVVGGSCINTAAAALVGGAYCGSAWTAATGIGSGQFLIKSYTSGIAGNSFALLVAGYEAADTTNAANYLTHYTVDTSKAYSGTSGTTANLIVS